MVPEGDWGSSGRKDTYMFELCDPFTLNGTGEYLDVPYGQSNITFGYYTDNYYSASITANTRCPENRLIRVKHDVELLDGTRASETMGTFFVKSSTESATQGLITWDLNCQSTWLRFTGDAATSGMQNASGENVTGLITNIVTGRGGVLKRIDTGADALTLSTACSHEMGDSVSTVLDDLANSAGVKIWVDDFGYVVILDIPDHANMQPVYTFIEGAGCTFKRSYQKSDSNDDKINHVVCLLSYENHDTDYVYSYKTEVGLDATDPFSYEMIGRYVTRTEEYQADGWSDYASLKRELQSKAQSILDENSGSIWYYEFEHVGIPGLRHGDVVRYVNYTDGENPIDVNGLVTQCNPTLNAGEWTSTKIKVIE